MDDITADLFRYSLCRGGSYSNHTDADGKSGPIVINPGGCISYCIGADKNQYVIVVQTLDLALERLNGRGFLQGLDFNQWQLRGTATTARNCVTESLFRPISELVAILVMVDIQWVIGEIAARISAAPWDNKSLATVIPSCSAWWRSPLISLRIICVPAGLPTSARR